MRSIQQLKDLYTKYVPSEKEGVFLLSLYQKIENEEVNQYFSYNEVEEVLRETYGTEYPHVNSFMGHLLNSFIERPRREESKYRLTEYASRFVELVIEQEESLRKKYSLSDSLNDISDFKSEAMRSYLDFERWYQQVFSDAARKTIDDHIAGLNSQLRSILRESGVLVHSDGKTLTEKVGQFAELFFQVSEKAKDIQQALQIRSPLFKQLRAFTELVYKESLLTSNQKYTSTDYNAVQKIVDNLRTYFNEVEERLESIIDKIRFAEEKLTDLQSNFNQYANRRVNLKRIIAYYLDNARYDRDNWIRFASEVPLKKLINERFRFTEVNKYDFMDHIPVNKFLPHHDSDNFDEEVAEVNREIRKQEEIHAWKERIFEELDKQHSVDLSAYFWKVYEAQQDAEMAIRVCFETINEAYTQQEYILDIVKELQSSPDKTIGIWQMTINRLPLEHTTS